MSVFKVKASLSKSICSSSPSAIQSMTCYTKPSSHSPPLKKQIHNAITGSIATSMEYVHGRFVGVRDRMASAKATAGESRSTVLQEVTPVLSIFVCVLTNSLARHFLYRCSRNRMRPLSTPSTTSSMRHSQFKVVHNKQSLSVDTGHPAG